MRNFATLIILIIGISSCAQRQGITFESKYKPDLMYTMTFLTESKSVLNFNGSKDKIDKLKAKGIMSPLISESKSEYTTKTTTGSIDSNRNFKATIEYGRIESIDKRNREEKKSLNPVSGLIINGEYDENNSFHIDTMISESFDYELKNTLKTSIEGIQNHIKFPDKPMKVGDSFDQNIPMSIPIADLPPIKVSINKQYKLVKIKKNIAYFSIKQTVTLDMETNQFNVQTSGGGNGSAELDIEKMFVTKNETNLALNLVITVNDLIINANIESKSNHAVIIENSNTSW